MQTIILLVVGKIVDAIIAGIGKYIAAKQAAKKKVDEYIQNKKEAKAKAEAYEKNPTPDNRDNVP